MVGSKPSFAVLKSLLGVAPKEAKEAKEAKERLNCSSISNLLESVYGARSGEIRSKSFSGVYSDVNHFRYSKNKLHLPK